MNRKLGRKKSNREHMIRNQAASLILFETIDTTTAKAKETKSFVERLISRNKAGDLSAVRRVDSVLFDQNAAKKLIVELLPRYKNRISGYIRSYHLKNRLGDNSSMMRLELVDKKVFVEKVETKITEKSKKVKEEKKDDDNEITK